MLNHFQSYSDYSYSLILKQTLYLSQKTENLNHMVMACEHLRNDKNIIGYGMGLHMMVKSSANVRPTVGPPSGHPGKRYFSWYVVGPALGKR